MTTLTPSQLDKIVTADCGHEEIFRRVVHYFGWTPSGKKATESACQKCAARIYKEQEGLEEQETKESGDNG